MGSDLLHAFQQAVACYGQQNWKSAEKLCRQILKIDPLHFDALHLLGSMFLQSQRFEEARLLLSQALKSQPSHPAVLNKLGIVCTHLKLADEALAFFSASLEVAPDFVETYLSRGALHEAAGAHEAALQDFARAVELKPDFPLGHFLLGNSLVAVGRHSEAVASYDQSLALAPAFADALHARGNAWRDLNKHHEAASSYEQAIRIDPNHFAALSSLADLQVQQQDHKAALINLDRVIRLQPDHQDALLIRARIRYERAELNLAHADFAKLIELNPKHAKAYEGIGNVHHRLNRMELALANYDKALVLQPTSGSAHLSRSAALSRLGDHVRALEANAKAMEISPDQPEVYTVLAAIQTDMRELNAAAESFRRACELKPDFVNAHSSLLYNLNFQAELSPNDRLLEYGKWEDRHAKPRYGKQYLHAKSQQAKRRLRLGYVSADMRRHAVGAFMAPIVASHDKQAFELFCYHCYPARDDKTELLARGFEHWIDAATLSDDELAERIHADGIDILVDLAGHTSGNRLLTFARKPAPVQITYLGYPGTTGMSAMDYRISDIFADPPTADGSYVETLLRLPHSMWCYPRSSELPDVGELPALTKGHLTLGSFNAFSKIDHRSIELWAQLMRGLPASRLVVATVPDGKARQEFLDAFASLGVEANRIDLLGFLPTKDFWKALERVDISLDPVSVNGATTTCESLWLGVPVITRVGSRFLERAGLSILTTAGLPEFACESDEAFVQLVKALANDLPKLSGLRAGLRSALIRTPLFDGESFTRSLESLYQQAWIKWVNGNDPAVA